MKVYEKSQNMLNEVIDDIIVYRDLVGDTADEKESKYGFVPGLNMKNEAIALEEQAQKLKEGIFQVLFTGGFNAGKSTLLNALMRKEVLSTAITAETAVITKIIFNADEKVIVYKKKIDKFGNAVKEELTLEEFFKKYRVSQERPDLFVDIDHVQLQQPQDGIGGSMVQLVDSPGTSNSEEDTAAAREFAKKASAIVYLMYAGQAFTQEDKEYIAKHFKGNNRKNVFFILNKFDLLSKAEREDLLVSAKKQLRDVFTDEKGVVDENLYEQRVFFTSAFRSVLARTGKTLETDFGPMTIDDKTTGVPRFEEALGKFLTDGDRDREALSAYTSKMANIYVAAEKKVKENLETYKNGLASVKEKKAELEEDIKKAENIIDNIKNSCTATAQQLLVDVRNAYDNTIASIESGWDSHFDRVDVRFSTLDLWKAGLTKDKAKQEALMKPISDAVKDYVDEEMADFNAGMEDILEANCKKLENQLNSYEEQLKALSSINTDELFDSIIKAVGATPDVKSGTKVNTFQLILGIVGADPEGITDAMSGNKSNKQATVSFLVRNVFEYVALNVVAWPLGLAMLGKRAWDMVKNMKDGGKKSAREFMKSMKTSTVADLRGRKTSMNMELEKKFGGAFVRAGNTVAKNIKNELEANRKTLEDTIQNLQNQNFDVEHEEERTEKILAEMVNRINHVCMLTKGKTYSAEQIKDELAEKA